jgi:glycosyltransferase involved in cell wall biosynthesis
LLTTLYTVSIKLACWRGYFRKTNLFIIPSAHIRDYLIASGVSTERVALHPHIVAAAQATGLPYQSTERYVAFLGRLSPEKGLMSVMKAAEQYPHIMFKIAGTGPLETQLTDYVEKHNLSNVKFCGFLKGQDKIRFLQQAALLVTPSECYESFGQVVVEANAVGTPVVAANHGGLASLVSDKRTGWLFNPGDEKHFFEVLQNAWSDPNLANVSRNAMEYFETSLSENKLIADLECSLESVVK